MSKCKVLLFAGTTEGRKLAEYLLKRQVRVHVCVATLYGESLLREDENLSISHERMDEKQMITFIKEFAPDCVVDATHPFAKEVTVNIRRACEVCEISYLRLLREKIDAGEATVYAASLEEAVSYLEQTKGNILVTTGSKNLEEYTRLSDYKERVFARVLSVKASVDKCEMLGITGKHLICMQGPFSVEMNAATIRDYEISWLVTKESGVTGGFMEKQEACERTGAKLLVIGRPQEEEGYSYSAMCQYLKNRFGLEDFWQVSLVGIGMGTEDSMTIEARKACQEADVLIGAKRMLEAVCQGKQTFVSYNPEEISSFIKSHPEFEKAAVLFSGDVGFYSGAKKQRAVLEKETGIEVKVIPGVSSGVCLCAKIGVSWDEVKFVSIHGRKCNLVSEVRKEEKLVVLAGNAEGLRVAMKELDAFGYGNLSVVVGSNLSYPTEKIQRGTVRDFTCYEGDSLSVFYIENPEARQFLMTQGIADEMFIRGNVPMTKEEVRCISISKMQLKDGMQVYDVGAGTGSVAIETALRIPKGHVYAIEKKPEALTLIAENKKKFGADNLTIVSGTAPEGLEELPAPDVVFIGGSSGNMEGILDTVIAKNPKVRIVVNVIALETMAEVLVFIKRKKICGEEIVQLQTAKSKNIGKYHMMTGSNPIYVISFTCDEE